MENTTKKVMVVINPKSGTRSKQDVPDLVRRHLQIDGWELETIITEYAGHATELAKGAAAQGYHGVVAVGGDGTINEVASSLINTSTTLGIVPCGSGNGLARHLCIPIDIEKSLQVIARQIIEDLDYCTVNNTPFFCTCGVGFDAHVSDKFAQAGTRGPVTYLKKTIAEYLKYHCKTYVLETADKTITEKAFVIACGNAAQYGNNAFITPNASIHDGLIDVTVIHPFTPFDTPLIGLLLFTKHLDQDTNIHCFRTSELTIRRDEPGIMHIDGEPLQMPADLHIKCHQAGIKVFVPRFKEDRKRSFITPLEEHFWNFVNLVRTELDI